MKTQKYNWWLDAALFLGFIVSFFLDLTGIELHQWLGIGLGILAFVHFACHINWISTVMEKFFHKTCGRARLNLLIDAGISMGFAGIILTGLVISTWLNLDLIGYTLWKNLHILISVFTLFAILVKLALHRKWIVNVAETHIFKRNNHEVVSTPCQPIVGKQVNRREFLKLGAVLGAGTLVGVVHLGQVFHDSAGESVPPVADVNQEGDYLDVLTSSQPAAQVTPTDAATQQAVLPTTVPTNIPAAQNDVANACSVRCPRGCAFPGRCRRYTDANGNGKCDLGECV